MVDVDRGQWTENHRGCEDFPCWAVSQRGPPEPGRSPTLGAGSGSSGQFCPLSGRDPRPWVAQEGGEEEPGRHAHWAEGKVLRPRGQGRRAQVGLRLAGKRDVEGDAGETGRCAGHEVQGLTGARFWPPESR